MDWLIYVIFGFIYWTQFPLFSWIVFFVVLAAICWYVHCDTAQQEEDDSKMSSDIGGDNYDI